MAQSPPSVARRALLFALLPAIAAAEDTCPARLEPTIAAGGAQFQRDGFAVLRGFADASEVAAMRDAMGAMVATWWRDERARAGAPGGGAVFRTDAGQEDAQAASRYFFDSADRVHFFREPPADGGVADDDDAAAAAAAAAAPPPLNKVGHGLHLNASTPFGRYARSARVAAVARRVAGLAAPVLPQSMYIFKAARVGGAVTSHQDGTFLYTRPHQTVVGLWLALDNATEDNGCLWARPGSHREPLRRRFVRSSAPPPPPPPLAAADGERAADAPPAEAAEVVMKFVDAAKDDDDDGRADSSARDEARFDPRLVGGGEGDDGDDDGDE